MMKELVTRDMDQTQLSAVLDNLKEETGAQVINVGASILTAAIPRFGEEALTLVRNGVNEKSDLWRVGGVIVLGALIIGSAAFIEMVSGE